MKLFKLVIMMIGCVAILNAANPKWAPIMMGDITTFIPYTPLDDTHVPLKTAQDTYRANEYVSIVVDRPLSGDHDWVGIYRVGDSNDWAHVIAWNWVGQGSTTLSRDKKPMPAGEYEIRLFFHNSYNMEASYAFRVINPQRESGTEGPYLDKVRSIKTSENGKVNNAIYYVEGTANLPTIIFMSGWKSNLESYDGFLKYIASLGYCVIAKQERGKCFTPHVYEQELSDRLSMVHNIYNADITKLGIIGHSSGGGTVHYLMDYFKSNHIAGNTKSVVISLDGWFPFGTTEALLNGFDTPTLLMQFGGFDGINREGIHPDWDDYPGEHYHHGQDPRINLAIFKSLTHAGTEKEYIVLEANNNHSYNAGDYDTIIARQDLLAPIDAFLDHTLGAGDAMNLIDQHGNVVWNPTVSEYQYYCHTAGFDFCDLDNLIFP